MSEQATKTSNRVMFVLVAVDAYNTALVTGVMTNQLLRDTVVFADCEHFNHEHIAMFGDWQTAHNYSVLLLNSKYVFTRVAMWESDYPNMIDTSYTLHGFDKNMEVKRNREAE